MAIHSSIPAWKSHGWRSLVGYSPRGHKESDTTERLHLTSPDVQVGFRKGRGTRDQIANIRWIIKKVRELQKNIYFCFIDYAKAFVWITTNRGKFLKSWEYQTTFPAS